MVYIQLATPIQGFGKVRIKEISFFDTNSKISAGKALGFKYQVYKVDGSNYISFYDKHVNIQDQDFINNTMSGESNTLSAYNYICKKMLQYLIDQSLESGTIEIEQDN